MGHDYTQVSSDKDVTTNGTKAAEAKDVSANVSEATAPAMSARPILPPLESSDAVGLKSLRLARVQRLQQRLGNYAVQQYVERSRAPTLSGRGDQVHTRLAVPTGATTFHGGALAAQRYEAGEHAQFGAKAGEAEKQFTVSGVTMSYGEMIAMGDLFESRDAVRKAKKTEIEALLVLIRRERDQGIGSVKEADWITAAGDRYLELAGKNVSHFDAPASETGFAEGDNNNKEQWFTYHNTALRLAQQNKMDEALKTNAFGDHFLTDAFSAGHLVNKTETMEKAKKNLKDPKKFERDVSAGILANAKAAKLFDYECNPGVFSAWAPMSVASLADVLDRVRFWESDKFYSTFSKAVHDKLNRDILPGGGGGVEVENNRNPKDKWRLSGDKTLSQSPETLRIGREAVAQSRKNVEDAAGQKNPDFTKLARVCGTLSHARPRPVRRWSTTPRIR